MIQEGINVHINLVYDGAKVQSEINTLRQIATVVFSLIMGLFGGFLPSLRAAKMNIVDALRSV